MTIQDPRILIILLNDLLEELKRWTITTRETSTDMSWYQNQAEEKVIQAQYNAAIIQDQASNDQKAVDQANDEVAQLLSNCYQGLENAQQNLRQAENSEHQVQSTLKNWQTELNLALAWLEKAEARLQRAIEERKKAKIDVRNAELELQNAQVALSLCQNSGSTDDKGRYHAPNCYRQEARVIRAKNACKDAIQSLNQAIEEEAGARDELTQAQLRVNCCRSAVGYSTQAVRTANIALNHANSALSFAERSLENAHAAKREVERAQIEAKNEQEIANLMSLAVNTAQKLTEEARSDFKEAENLGNLAQRLEVAVSRELEDRVESLIELNRPPLF